MKFLPVILGIAAALILLVLLAAYVCFRIVFYVPTRKNADSGEFTMPPGKIYLPYRDTMEAWTKEAKALPFKAVSIRAFDGLTLRGKYYEYAPGAPVELMFHGYRGSAERDLCGGIQRAFALGRSVLLADQRASSRSGGHVISFGINESRDCHAWVNFMVDHFGPEVRIILTGISMGAATVLIAAGDPMPENVIGVLADCGYTSAKEIIKKCARQIRVPDWLVYPFIRLGARIYGHFNLEETSPLEAMSHCRLPVIFIHGEDDDFVPCEMTLENYNACTAPKKLLTVPGAGHGMCYLLDPEGYLKTLKEFSYETAASQK